MRPLLVSVLVTLALASCSSTRDSDGGSSFNDLGSSISGGFGRNTDTYGTMRRMDVYGGTTAPTMPTIATPGFGK